MGVAEYLNKEKFLQSMGLVGDETKYGNRDGEHQSRSYGTWMGYEIMDSVEDSIVEEDVVEVVRCKDCKHYTEGMAIGMCKRNPERPLIPIPYNHYCGFGERRTE